MERVLIHYLKLLFEKTGLKWDGDNEAEIIDLLYDWEQDIVEKAINEMGEKYELKYRQHD